MAYLLRHLGFFLLVAVFAAFLALQTYLRQALLFLIGVGLGAVLAGARFGFTSGWRQLIEDKNPQGVAGQLLLLAVATCIALPLLAISTELRPALGPLSMSLLLGAFVFGVAMQIADGCGSGTLYKAGLGIPLNMAILPLFAFGSFLGAVQLPQWHTRTPAGARTHHLPASLQSTSHGPLRISLVRGR